jgi:hypothetical protein
MNKLPTQILSLMICMELVLAPFPKYSYADEVHDGDARGTNSGQIHNDDNSVTSPAAYLKAVQAEAEALFDPTNGLVRVDEDGTPHCKNTCTQAAIHGDPAQKAAQDCEARLAAFGPKWNKAMAMTKEFNKTDQSSKNGSSCSNCSAEGKIINTDFMVPEGGLCSKKEKDKIANDFKTKPACGVNATGLGDCLVAIKDSFVSSMKSMGKTAWGFATGLGNAVTGGIFSGNKTGEKHATERSLVLSGLDQKTVTKAQEDAAKASRTWLESVGNFMGAAVEFIGVDFPQYKELYQCAKCGERTAAFCKMVGVLGKDAIKNAFIIWGTGKAIQGLGILKGKLAGGMARTVEGRAMIAWGSKAWAPVSKAAISGFERFASTKVGKVVVGVVGGTFKVMDHAMNGLVYPVKLAVRGGKAVATETAAAARRFGIFKATPGVGEKMVGEEAASTVAKVSESANPLEIEANRVETPKMTEAKRFVANQKNLRTGAKVDVTDVANATESKFAKSGESAVKVDTPSGEQYFNVKNSNEVKQVYPYREGKSAIIRMNDGSLLLAEDGRIATTVAKKDAPKLEALLGSEQAKSDQLLLKQTIDNAEVNGIKMSEEVESKVANEAKANKASFETGPECGNKKIIVSAGRAL